MASARDDYMTILPANDSDGADNDTEQAFEGWRESLKNSQAQGTLRVQRIPLDENESPQWNAQAASELFSAPIDRYSFEELVSKIKRDYIRPNESKIAVRLMGVKAGERGLKFNRLLVVERENVVHTASPSNNPSDLLRAVQEMNAQNVAMMRGLFQEMVSNRPIAAAPAPIDPVNMVMQMMTAMGGFMAAMNKSASGGGSMKEMVETMVALKGLSDDFTGNGGTDENGGAAAIIKAATPLAVPLLQSLTEASKTVRMNHAQVRRAPPAPAQPTRVNVRQVAPVQPVKENPAPRESSDNLQEGNEVLQQIRPHLDTLCQLADEKTDPAEVAEMVLDVLETTGKISDEQIFQLVSNTKLVQHLRLLNRKVGERTQWFESVRLAILAAYEDDTGDGADETGEPAPPSGAPDDQVQPAG